MKVFLYMAAGRPILGPQIPDIAEVLRDGHNALLVRPDDYSAATQGLRRLLGDDALQRALAENALIESRSHSWARRAQRIIDFLKSRL